MLDRLTIERAVAVSNDGPIVVALSGGGDSTALLHLLADKLGPARLRAVVIDHALREGSAADAARAAGFAEALGVRAEVVRLAWSANTNRAQQATRSARYTALCDAARRLGARVIATGHTRDDQAETVLLRAERGSGWRGLAGMKVFTPLPFWPEGRDLWLARPLLRTRRTELRAFLEARTADWIEDPANANDAYARVRARRALSALEAAGFDPMRLAALAERLAPRAEALDAEAAALIRSAACFLDDMIVIARESWQGEAARERALAVLVAAAGGAARTANEDQVTALAAQMDAPDFRSATLGGALIATSTGGWRLSRDVGALEGRADGGTTLPPRALVPNQENIWDRRLAVVAETSNWSVAHARGRPVFLQNGEATIEIQPSMRWLLAERAAHLLGVVTASVLQSPPERTP